jgi:hypothetical protein
VQKRSVSRKPGIKAQKARGTCSFLWQTSLVPERTKFYPRDQSFDDQNFGGGVENGDHTFSQGRNSADTLEHCEDAVATADFWGHIATYFSSVYKK